MKKNNAILFTAAAMLLSGSVFASTYEYFTIYQKNIAPVYNEETIQIDGVEPTNVELTTPDVKNSVSVPQVDALRPKVMVEAKTQEPVKKQDVVVTVQEKTPSVEVATPKVEQTKSLAKVEQAEKEPVAEQKVEEKKLEATVSAEANVHFGKSMNDLVAQKKYVAMSKNLVKNAKLKSNFTFDYSPEDVVNAYARIDGLVMVFRGLLDYCEKEDELAFVIGHELSHIENKDSYKQAVVDKGIELGGNVASKYAKKAVSNKFKSALGAFGVNADAATDVAISTTQAAASAKYSRMHESRADQCGIDYIVKSGYNPLAGISIMYKIGDMYEDLFEDHPSTEKRLQNMYKYVAEKYPQYIKNGFATEAYEGAKQYFEK